MSLNRTTHCPATTTSSFIFCSMLFALLFSIASAEEAGSKKASRLNPREYHVQLVASAQPKFTFTDDTQFETWQPALRTELVNILGLDKIKKAPLNPIITQDESTDEYDSFRVIIQSEQGVDIPCFLLKPKNAKPGPLPTMICLQGHKKKDGMLVSIGRVADNGGRDIAIQSIQHGWAALAVEQRCFGERLGDCKRESLDALMLGRTLTGERVFDVMRAIDFIETQDDLDASRIGCMGNSTGGTVTFYAACVDPRIRVSVVSCSYCTYAESWIKIQHCACGYLPGILNVADMGDLAGLVAPRELIIVAGKEDYLATITGVQTAFDQTQRIFTTAGCKPNASLLVGNGGHNFYPELAWPVIQKSLEKWNTK